MEHPSLKTMYRGAFWLTAAQLLSKILSALYKVPLQNWTGDQGFYVYQQLYPFYGLVASFSLTAMPLFISKLLSDDDDPAHSRAIHQQIFVCLMAGLSILGLSLALFSRPLSRLMGDIDLAPGLRMIALYYPLGAVLASFRGYFQSRLQMSPTAVSQVAEQLVRVACILLVAYLFLQGQGSIYQMGAWAYGGALGGGILAASFLLWRYKRQVVKASTSTKQLESSLRPVFKLLLGPALLYGGIVSILVVMQLIDSFTVVRGLLEAGFSPEAAQSAKGIYDRALPLAQLGLVATTGLSSSMLPYLNRLKRQVTSLRYGQALRSFVKLVFLFSAAAAVGLMALMPSLNRLLFQDSKASSTLAVFMGVVVWKSLILVCLTISQVQGLAQRLWGPLGLTLLAKWLGNVVLIPRLHIMGAALASHVSLAVFFLYVFSRLKKRINLGGGKVFDLLKSCLALLVMGLAVRLTLAVMAHYFPASGLGLLIQVLVGVGMGVVVFFTGLVRLGLISDQEWQVLLATVLKVKRSDEYDMH